MLLAFACLVQAEHGAMPCALICARLSTRFTLSHDNVCIQALCRAACLAPAPTGAPVHALFISHQTTPSQTLSVCRRLWWLESWHQRTLTGKSNLFLFVRIVNLVAAKSIIYLLRVQAACGASCPAAAPTGGRWARCSSCASRAPPSTTCRLFAWTRRPRPSIHTPRSTCWCASFTSYCCCVFISRNAALEVLRRRCQRRVHCLRVRGRHPFTPRHVRWCALVLPWHVHVF